MLTDAHRVFRTKDCAWLRWDLCTSPAEQKQCQAQLTCWLKVRTAHTANQSRSS